MKTKNRIWLIPLIVMGLVLILTHSCKKDENTPETITDKDGNVYTSVTIGTQVWMVENLKTTKYNDGTAIPNVTDNTEWSNLTTPAYCWYDNDIANKATYGALYNWYATNTSKLCPTGWHVATDDEWHQMILSLDPSAVLNNPAESQIAGIKLKEQGNSHWESSSQCTPATNESGFTALPGGVRGGTFYYMGQYGYFWPSAGTPVTRVMMSFADIVLRDGNDTSIGESVRCIKD
jgi:uncharacterized protein (TIGR02145 family)